MKSWLSCVLAISGVWMGGGCRGNSSAFSERDKGAFENASPELKQTWQAALEASRTNDFEGAKKLFYSLAPESTPEQQQAVKRALTALDEKFSEALHRGDPAAQQALDALRKNPPNRNR